MDLLVWEFGLPGRAETIWSGSLIKGTLTFPPGELASILPNF